MWDSRGDVDGRVVIATIELWENPRKVVSSSFFFF